MKTKSNYKELFKNALRCAQDLKSEIGENRKVYSARSIYLLYRLSSIEKELGYENFYNVTIGKLRKQKLEKDRDEAIKTIRRVDGYDIDIEEHFYEQKYLDATCVSIKDLIASQGPDALCFPRKDWVFILPFYWEYPTYKFLERYRSAVGEKEFLANLVRLEYYIKLAKVNDTFYWDNHSMTSLHEYDRAKKIRREMEEEDCIGKK